MSSRVIVDINSEFFNAFMMINQNAEIDDNQLERELWVKKYIILYK